MSRNQAEGQGELSQSQICRKQEVDVGGSQQDQPTLPADNTNKEASTPRELQLVNTPTKPTGRMLSFTPTSPCKSETHQKATQGSDKKSSSLQEGCGCSKSGCLKLYCACFANGVLCGSECCCFGCKNSTDNPERAEAIHEVIMTDPMAFSKRSHQFGVGEGCNCRKSGCNKKYCECYRRGMLCLDRCTCFQCKNMKEGHVRTENRVMPSEDTFRLTFDLLKKKIKLP